MVFSSVERPIWHRIIFLFLMVLSHSFSFGQKNELDIRNIDASRFPRVISDLWIRDPDGLNPANVVLTENGKQIKISINTNPRTDSLPVNKCVVFLVLNPGSSGKSELRWYRKVINEALKTGVINNGDKVDVLDFNNESNGQLLYPNFFTFTDQNEEIRKKLDAIRPRNTPSLCGLPILDERTLIRSAINRTLKMLEQENLSIPTCIVVLSDDVGCTNFQDNETPGARSRRLNIPIYAITYSDPEQINSIRELCAETYGEYYKDLRRNVDASTAELEQYLTNFIKRQNGSRYTFEYNSNFEKDGKLHQVKVEYTTSLKRTSTEFTLQAPKKNLLEWIVANPIPSAGIFLGIVLLFVLVIVIINKSKKKARAEKLMQQLQMTEMERKQQEAENALKEQLAGQQSEVDAIKERERQQKLAEEKKVREEQKQKNDVALAAKMRMRGNYPWFDFVNQGNNMRFEVSKPEILAGRSNECDLHIDNPTVSRRHFTLRFRNDHYTIEDLQSANGLYVNGKRVQQATLRHGDIVQIGEVVLNFRV